MSQYYSNNSSSTPPPSVPTEFDTQSGNAVPASNVLIIDAFDTSQNNNNGITTKGGVAAGDPPGTGATNEVSIYLTNRLTGSVTTADATLTTIITLPMGATPGTYHVYGDAQAFNTTTPASGAYSFSGGFRTDGVTASELGVELHDEFEDATLVSADIFVSASGNNIILSVQGVAGLNINWNSLMEYRIVT